MTTTEIRHKGSVRFEETHWSVVGQLAGTDESAATKALAKLCSTYRLPLYCLARQRGLSKEDAEDMVQDFQLDLIKREAWKRADPSRGRLREFLKQSLKNFLNNQWDRKKALKRGGGMAFIPYDLEEGAESTYAEIASSAPQPEVLYDRAWARATLDRVLAEFRAEYSSARRERLYAELEPMILGGCKPGKGISYQEIAMRLSMTEEGVRMAASRMRTGLKKLLRRHVERTLDQNEDVEAEIRYLISCA